MTSEDFAGKHVVVTGGSGALGRAVVDMLLDRGAFCHVPVYHENELLLCQFRDHERVRIEVGVDLSNEESATGFYEACPQLWASIQIAGGFRMGPIADTPVADFDFMMKINATTSFLSNREAIKKIRASGGEGRLVNVAAKAGIVGGAGMVPYAASKAAVASMTVSLAEELHEEGIWVNAVVPSIMDTEQNRKDMPDADHSKWPKVNEVASTIVFLASPGNGVTRGALIPVYGRS